MHQPSAHPVACSPAGFGARDGSELPPAAAELSSQLEYNRHVKESGATKIRLSIPIENAAVAGMEPPMSWCHM